MSRLVAALAGDVRLVLVVGDAGVGKTRFAGEAMARAATAGMVTVRGECLPLARARCRCCRSPRRWMSWPGWTAGLCWRRRWRTAAEYVRGEVGRLIPGLGPGGGPGPGGRDEGWQRERLFSAVAELLDAAASNAGGGIGLVVEDVHWADSATLDFLTFLTRAGHRDTVTVVATYRGDETPVAVHGGGLADPGARRGGGGGDPVGPAVPGGGGRAGGRAGRRPGAAGGGR